MLPLSLALVLWLVLSLSLLALLLLSSLLSLLSLLLWLLLLLAVLALLGYSLLRGAPEIHAWNDDYNDRSFEADNPHQRGTATTSPKVVVAVELLLVVVVVVELLVALSASPCIYLARRSRSTPPTGL